MAHTKTATNELNKPPTGEATAAADWSLVVLVDGGLVVVEVGVDEEEPVSEGVVGVVEVDGDAALTETESFMPLEQWPAAPQMK